MPQIDLHVLLLNLMPFSLKENVHILKKIFLLFNSPSMGNKSKIFYNVLYSKSIGALKKSLKKIVIVCKEINERACQSLPCYCQCNKNRFFFT